MKKVIVFLLLVISVNVRAQKYVPFPSGNAQWNVFYASSLYGSPLDTTLLKYTIKGDTMIYEVGYHKLCKNIGSDENPQYVFAGGLRELDKKIFFYGFGYSKSILVSPSNKEYLLYDFNKEIGDSVMFDQERWYKIINIDSVKIGSNFRKRYQIRIDISPESEYIIEGIGNVNQGLLGMITPIPTCWDCHIEWEFVCFSQNGASVYKNPAYVDCNSLLMNSISESKASNQFIQINPNPTKEYIHLQFEFADKKNITIEIIDIAGKRIATIPVTTGLLSNNLDVSQYPAGVYFVLIHSPTRNEVHKIIKL
jgi:hypothetical protein